MFKVFYRGKDAGYPSAKTEAEALAFYIKTVMAETGETKEEILEETWASPQGVKKCVSVEEVSNGEAIYRKV